MKPPLQEIEPELRFEINKVIDRVLEARDMEREDLDFIMYVYDKVERRKTCIPLTEPRIRNPESGDGD